MAGQEECGTDTSLQLNVILIMASGLSLGFSVLIITFQRHMNKIGFLSFHVVYIGIMVDTEFVIFIFLLPFFKNIVLPLYVWKMVFPHLMLYFQCYLCVMFLLNYFTPTLYN